MLIYFNLQLPNLKCIVLKIDFSNYLILNVLNLKSFTIVSIQMLSVSNDVFNSEHLRIKIHKLLNPSVFQIEFKQYSQTHI